jgi:hypothetical protein
LGGSSARKQVAFFKACLELVKRVTFYGLGVRILELILTTDDTDDTDCAEQGE